MTSIYREKTTHCYFTVFGWVWNVLESMSHRSNIMIVVRLSFALQEKAITKKLKSIYLLIHDELSMLVLLAIV